MRFVNVEHSICWCQILRTRIEPEAGERNILPWCSSFYHPALVRISKTKALTNELLVVRLNTKRLIFTHFIVQCELMSKMPFTCTFRAPYSSFSWKILSIQLHVGGKQGSHLGNIYGQSLEGMCMELLFTFPLLKAQSYGFV